MLTAWLCVAAVVALLNGITAWRARRAERRYPPIGEFLAVEGVRLHYVDRGTGTPIVLLHGSDGCIQDFEAVVQALSERYRAIAFDRPGHGWSSAPPGSPNTPATQLSVIRSAMKRLGVACPILVGHSWSGVLLTAMAAEHPDEIGGIVSVSAYLLRPARIRISFELILTWVLLAIPRIPLVGAFLVSTFTPLVKDVVLRWSLSHAFAPGHIPDAYGNLAHAFWLRTPDMVRALAEENVAADSQLEQLQGRYPTLRTPVVILASRDDEVVNPSEHACKFHAMVPGSELRQLAHGSHELPLTAPQEVVAAIDHCVVLAKQQGTLAEPDSVVSDFDRARELVLRYGWNVTAYQILAPEIEHWFSSEQDAVVGFVRHYGVRVAAGAPVCAEERLAAVAAEFEAHAESSGENVCWFGAGTRLEALLRTRDDHTAVVIGAQPVWHPADWPEIVRRTSSLRSQMNRAQNKGVTVEEWNAERVAADEDLRRCQREWLEKRGLPPLRFVTEPVSLGSMGDRRVFVATMGGKAVGYLIATPVPQRRGWLVEQIVRGKEAPNGTSELLVDHAMRALGEADAQYVTLGLAPLSQRIEPRAGPADPPLPLIRLLFTWARAHGKRFYNFEGLDAFKAKFRPDSWEPIYAVANERPFRLRTLFAIAAAFSGGPPMPTVLRAISTAVRQEIAWLLRRPSAHSK